jgi:putative ABC transport system substrate-binding protein
VRELKLSAGDDVPEKVVRLRPDAVVAVGTGAFKQSAAVKDLPVIHLMVMPAEAARALRPNISGVNMDPAPADYFSAMAEVFPRTKRIGLVYDPRFMGAYVADAEKAARTMGISLVTRRVDSASAIPAALEDLRGKIDVLWMLPDPTVVATGTVELLLQYSFRTNVPVFSFSRKYVEMGAVASLDVDPYDMGTQAAGIARRMIGDAAEPMRVYARKHNLAINEIVAAKMGIMIGSGDAGRIRRDD